MAARRFFEPLADHAGEAYLRYSFTKGTGQEVDALLDALDLRRGDRLLDVGCGPGRHCAAFASAGLNVTGVDLSERFVRLAAGQSGRAARFARGDALALPVRPGSMDAVVSICQGGLGLLGGGPEEASALAEMAGALRPGGRLAVSVPSAYFAVRTLEPGECFDAAAGVLHEVSRVRDAGDTEADFDLWSTCFTPRELRLMCAAAGCEVQQLWSVSPGSYRPAPPDLQHPELLVLALRH